MLSKSSQTSCRALTLHETKQWRCRGVFSQDFCCLNANAELTQWLTSVPFSRFLRRALGALLLFPRQANPGSLGPSPAPQIYIGMAHALARPNSKPSPAFGTLWAARLLAGCSVRRGIGKRGPHFEAQFLAQRTQNKHHTDVKHLLVLL